MSGYGYGAVGGPDTIVGIDTIIGALAPVVGAEQAVRLATAMAAARDVDPNAVAVEARKRDTRRRLIMGNAPTTIPLSGVSTPVTFTPQQLFRCEAIVIPSEIAPDLRLQDIKVGNRSQLLTSGSLPATAFSEVSYNSHVHLDSADVGNTLTLDVISKNGTDVTFECMLVGTAVI